jgi:hypothetical protein
MLYQLSYASFGFLLKKEAVENVVAPSKRPDRNSTNYLKITQLAGQMCRCKLCVDRQI